LSNEVFPESVKNLPDWVQYIWDAHLGGSSQTFILHGNVNDLIPVSCNSGIWRMGHRTILRSGARPARYSRQSIEAH
jgi:hypothetical protein